jgi:hypothetical protein
MPTQEFTPTGSTSGVRKVAIRFVLLIGVLSFFADFTYEGSRSILGPYLGTLGANATVVGIVAPVRSLRLFRPHRTDICHHPFLHRSFSSATSGWL